MSKPIRVLQVFGKLNRGGAEISIMNLYRKINRSKVQFDFIVHTEKKCAFDDEIRSLGGKIFRIPSYKGKNHFQYKQAWHSFFKKHPEYRIIHGHVRSTASLYLRIAKKYGLKTIAHSHNTSSGYGFKGLVKNVFQIPIRYTADYFFACSQPAGVWLFGHQTCRKKNFYVIKNAIDANKFGFNPEVRIKKRRELGVQEKLVIGHVGRFCQQKNHLFLIDIFKEIKSKKEKSILLLVGDGELRSLIEDKIFELGLNESVVFTGVRSDVPELVQAMDVLLFPSLYEGLPVTLIEAQTAGLPCIISKNIPDEVMVTKDLVSFVSLSETPERWSDLVIENAEGFSRRNRYPDIVKAGYDVNTSAKWLQEFYLEKSPE